VDREEGSANLQPHRSWNRVIQWGRRERELSIVLVLVLVLEKGC
jgi:hypothetical protein